MSSIDNSPGARKKHTRKRAVGGILVYCRGCGRRGVANSALLPPGKRTIDQCRECRKDRDLPVDPDVTLLD